MLHVVARAVGQFLVAGAVLFGAAGWIVAAHGVAGWIVAADGAAGVVFACFAMTTSIDAMVCAVRSQGHAMNWRCCRD